MGTARNNIKSTNPDIYVTGYSNTYLSLPELHGRRATAIGKLTSLDYYNLHYDTDTTGGNSGAPVYVVNSNGTKTVIGIHCYGSDVTNENNDYNYCTRITTDILHFVYNNSNLSW